MPVVTITPPDHEFAAASGSNVNWDPDWSYFDHPPNSTTDLIISSNAGDSDPYLFEVGETYDITWAGHGGGTMEDATIIRSDDLGPGQGVVVFEGINSNNGELFQMVWTPNFDLENWYWSNGGGPSSPNAFWTSDQAAGNYQMPCYAEGTLISTPGGSVPVENLKTGDIVNTLDHGPQPVVLVQQAVQDLTVLREDQRPVLLPTDSFGPNCPDADLVLSPQHRVFAGGRGQLAEVFDGEVFVPAKALTDLPGIRYMNGKKQITWVHFACPHHEVITANGCLSESLLLGRMITVGRALTSPDAIDVVIGPNRSIPARKNVIPARPCLGVQATRDALAASALLTSLDEDRPAQSSKAG